MAASLLSQGSFFPVITEPVNSKNRHPLPPSFSFLKKKKKKNPEIPLGGKYQYPNFTGGGKRLRLNDFPEALWPVNGRARVCRSLLKLG